MSAKKVGPSTTPLSNLEKKERLASRRLSAGEHRPEWLSA